MSRYRKIETRTWSDEKFRSLSPMPPSGQGLWLYLLTGPHTGPIPGLFRAGRGGLADELGWDLKGFDRAFREITDKGMAKADFIAKLIWIPNAIKHNPPASPNVVKTWGKEFILLPESPLKAEAFDYMKAFVEGMSEGFANAFREVFRAYVSKPKPMPSPHPIVIQEQEQEQDIDPSREGKVRLRESSAGRAPIRLGESVAGYGSVGRPPADRNRGCDDDDLDADFGGADAA